MYPGKRRTDTVLEGGIFAVDLDQPVQFKRAPCRHVTIFLPGALLREIVLLIADAFGEQAGLKGSKPALARAMAFDQARRYVHANLHDDGLSPDRVVESLGLSRPTVYRLFQHEGGLGAYIRPACAPARRRRRARRMARRSGAGHRLCSRLQQRVGLHAGVSASLRPRTAGHPAVSRRRARSAKAVVTGPAGRRISRFHPERA
ncbi:hypothetical protein [Trinickia mobilis]|uniref:hypothetical protein n=1 Tax=Trinickia mobilis TaxID=2816356 RepID=UPI00403FDC12